MLDVPVIVAPDSLNLDLLRRYQEAGVNRLVLPLMAGADEGGKTLEHLAQLATVVEQAQKV